MRRTSLAAIALAIAFALPPGVAAADPTPSADTTPVPAPNSAPSPKPTLHPARVSPKPLRSAVNLCDHALLYTWPKQGGIPNRADVPPAQPGERFQIQAGPRHTLDGRGYYETTIPEPAGMGGGDFYWVSDRCFTID